MLVFVSKYNIAIGLMISNDTTTSILQYNLGDIAAHYMCTMYNIFVG